MLLVGARTGRDVPGILLASTVWVRLVFPAIVLFGSAVGCGGGGAGSGEDADGGAEAGSGDAALDGSTGDDGDVGLPGELAQASVDGITYSYFIPDCLDDGEASAPAIYTFHGSGGRGAGIVARWAPVAAEHCFVVVGQDSEDPRGWGFGDDGARFLAVLEDTRARFDVDPSRRFVHGYSAGAHWIYGFGLFNSDHFAGIAVYAGSLAAAMRDGIWPDQVGLPIPVFIGHGTDDATVPYDEARFARDQLDQAGWPVTLWALEGGTHAYADAHQEAAWLFWLETDGAE